jgi:hypothetical protein
MLGFLEHHVREGAIAVGTASLPGLGRFFTSARSSNCTRFLSWASPTVSDGLRSSNEPGRSVVRSEWIVVGGVAFEPRSSFPTFGIATEFFGIFRSAIQDIGYRINLNLFSKLGV